MVLFVGSQKVELLSSKAKVDVVDEDSSCSLTQLFQNPGYEKDDQEAVYKFPLQSSAAVYLFETQFLSKDGTVLNSLSGKCFEKEEAREKFNQAKETGKTVQLLEVDYDNSPDVFVMSLGNIKKDCQFVKIQVAYYVPLNLEAQSTVTRLTLPSRVSPRLANSEVVQQAVNVVDWRTVFDLEVSVSLSSPVSMIESPSHKIQTKMNVDGSPMKAKVLLAEEDVLLFNDFVLKISAAEVSKNSMIVQTPDSIINKDFASLFGDSTIAKLTFMPEFKTSSEDSIKNFIFVIDRSGSMSGANMRESKKALLLCLTSLPENCLFNIISFGSSHSSLFPKSVAYSEESLRTARDHVEGMDANMGGTEILTPLNLIIGEKSDVQKVLFVLTDGEVNNTAKVVAAVKKAHEQSGTRLFSCGIGSGVSQHLVEGIAKAGGGTSTFIAYGERMNAKIAGQMEQAMETPFTDLKIDFSGLKQSASKLSWDPSTVLPKFANPGQLMTAYVAVDVKSLIDAKGDEKSCIKLLGSRASEKDVIIGEIELTTGMIETASNLIVPALKQQITLVEESNFEKKSARKKAVDFAICANIVTKYTSLLAVDENEAKKEEATNEKVAVPVLPSSPPSFSGMNAFAAPVRSRRAKPSAPVMRAAQLAESRSNKVNLEMDFLSGLKTSDVNLRHAGAMPMQKNAANKDDGILASLMGRLKSQRQSLPDKEDEDSESDFSDDEKEGGASVPKSHSFAPPSKMAVAKKTVAMTPAPKTDLERLDALVAIQKRDGSFSATQQLLDILGVADFGGDLTDELATAVVIQFLEMKLAEHRAEWNLMHKKAAAFVQKNAKDQEELITNAKAIVQKM